MAKTTIYLIRHAQSQLNRAFDNNEQYKEHGELGSDLSSEGVKQAHHVADRLKNIHFDAIFSSDLLRAKHTADTIVYGRNMTVVTSSLLRERSWGAWKGLVEGEKIKTKIKQLQRGFSDKEKMKVTVGDVESEFDAVLRLRMYLKGVERDYEGETVCIVAHGNIMRSFLVLIGWATYDELPVGAIKNTGYMVLEAENDKFFVKKTWGIEKKTS